MQGWSANVSTLYVGLPFLDRLSAAARDGFRCIEFWTTEDHDAVARAVRDLGLAVSVINLDQGPEADDAGRLSDPDAVAWWRTEFQRTVEFAGSLDCPAVNVLVGGRRDLPLEIQRQTMVRNLEWALAAARTLSVSLLLEPLNRADRPDYLLHSVDDVVEVRTALGEPEQLKLLFDVYHLHQEHEAVAQVLERHGHILGHIQLADYPGRGEPGSGEIDFDGFLRAVERCGYGGWLGLEYLGPDSSRVSLGWVRELQPVAAELAAQSTAGD